MKKCPCEECIVKAMCHLKNISELNTCEILFDYLYSHDIIEYGTFTGLRKTRKDYLERIEVLYKSLKNQHFKIDAEAVEIYQRNLRDGKKEN